MTQKTRLLLICAVLICTSLSAQSCDPAPSVTITQAGRYRQKGIRLHWTIVNNDSQPIFVYSTFLLGPRAAAWRKRPDGLIEIHSSLPDKIDMLINDYPKAMFMKIDANKERSGTLINPSPTVLVNKSDRVLITVAYGRSIQGVQEAIDKHHQTGTGHPGNPIVDWQCVVFSAAVPLR